MKNKYIIIYLFCLAVIIGPAFTIADNYNARSNVDCITYMGVAEYDFNQSTVRKYRVIVPFAASVVNECFGSLFNKVAPWSFPDDFAIGMSFLIINCALMALFGLLVFIFLKAYSGNIIALIVALISVLTCRWTAYLAGLPLVDSLFLVAVMLTLTGIKTKNKAMIIIAIFIGPWAKESFIFIAPIIFFFAPVGKLRQSLLFLISGALVFSARYCIDIISNTSLHESLYSNLIHFSNIKESVVRLFSFHGLYEIFSVTGLWPLFLFPAIYMKRIKTLKRIFEPFIVCYIASVVFQSMLSTEIARMLYMLTPLLALIWTIIIDEIMPKQWGAFCNDSNK